LNVTDKTDRKKDWNIMRQKIDPKDGQRWPLECYLFYMPFDRREAYDYFVKSYRPNSRPPFVFFSESANSNNPISLQVPEMRLPLYTVLGRGTDMGLK
jgi:hypothetical protein